MAVITGYASLQTAIAEWLARGDLGAFLPNFIQNWEEKFYRQPKNFGRWMETTLNVTIADSVALVPNDYLELKHAYINGSPSTDLDRMSLKQIYGKYPRGGCTGLPRQIARERGNFIFGPAPDSNYVVKGIYYGKPDPMRDFDADAAEHWIIMNAPDLALYGALCEAEPFLRNDARVATWKSLYAESLQDYRELHKEEDLSGSPVQEVLA